LSRESLQVLLPREFALLTGNFKLECIRKSLPDEQILHTHGSMISMMVLVIAKVASSLSRSTRRLTIFRVDYIRGTAGWDFSFMTT
jgi:hypothetical protein